MDISNTSVLDLKSHDRAELLNLVDELRAQGLNEVIALPELIVCGDTSSGKSSLLRSLSGVRFPTGGDICTRHPTQLSLRHSAMRSAKATIRWSSSAETKAPFEREIPRLDSLGQLFAEAEQAMGLKDNKKIVTDVLKLEIAGPDLPHLTLVDLPGLMEASTSKVTKENARKLVEDHMQNPRSIILEVVAASNHPSNQTVLSLGVEHDPDCQRIIGVITKPDEISESYQAQILELANNQNPEYRARKWHVVRNRNDKEREDEDFDHQQCEKDVFSKLPWKRLSQSQLGVQSLIVSVTQILDQHLRNELPAVLEELQAKISITKANLSRLGRPRITASEQRLYLTRLGKDYEELIKSSLNGDYGSNDWIENSELKLRSEIRDLTDDFEIFMQHSGHKYGIKGIHPEPPSGEPLSGRKTMFDALQEIDSLLRRYRGLELPHMFNPTIVGKLFREQSESWALHAHAFAEKVLKYTNILLKVVLEHITGEQQRTSQLVLNMIIKPELESRAENVRAKIEELLTPYRQSQPFATARRFERSLQTVEAKLVAANLGPSGNLGDPVACRALLKSSVAYYNVALETFIDNVVSLAIENCILANLQDIFSPGTVSQMEDKTLATLGSETSEITIRRMEEERRLKILEDSLKLCKDASNRESTVPNIYVDTRLGGNLDGLEMQRSAAPPVAAQRLVTVPGTATPSKETAAHTSGEEETDLSRQPDKNKAATLPSAANQPAHLSGTSNSNTDPSGGLSDTAPATAGESSPTPGILDAKPRRVKFGTPSFAAKPISLPDTSTPSTKSSGGVFGTPPATGEKPAPLPGTWSPGAETETTSFSTPAENPLTSSSLPIPPSSGWSWSPGHSEHAERSKSSESLNVGDGGARLEQSRSSGSPQLR